MALIECPKCQARVDARLLATHTATLSHEEGDSYQSEALDAQDEDRFDYDAELDPENPCGVYALLGCPVCQDVFLAYKYDFELEHSYTRLWPSIRRAHHELPADIRHAFDEALKCQAAGAFQACLLMCRKVIESVCRHHFPDVKPLAFGLKKLHDEGVIDNRLFSWAEALRDAGNLSAHEPGAQVTEQDARDLVYFTEAILNYVFVISERFHRFKERQNKSGPTRALGEAQSE